MIELNDFIAAEERSGSILINQHLLVRHKRYSIPISAFILTVIAVAVASFKRRGGMVVAKSNFSPALAAWLPLAIFGLLALGLLNYAKR